MGIGVGLDPGTDSVKVVQVRTGPGGVSILSAARIPRPASGEFPVGGVIEALRRAGIPRRGTLGFSGKGLMLSYISMPPVPPWRLRMLVEYEINENLAKGGADVASDYCPLNLPLGLDAGLVVLAALAKTAPIEGAFAMARAAGVRPNRAFPAAVALYRGFAASHEYKPDETTLLLDVGRENVELAIQRDGELLFARNGSGAGTGERVTQGIDGALALGRDRAEEYKRSKVMLSSGPPTDADERQRSIYSTLREAGDALVGAVTGGVRFARIQTKLKDIDYDRLVLTGGAARLAGLKEFLENRLKKPVTLYDPAAALDSSGLSGRAATEFDGAPSSMAVATGLAIADAEREGFALELLPPREAAGRQFWGRKVFAYASAAVALALAGTMVVSSRLGLASARAEREALAKKFATLEARASEAKSLERRIARRGDALQPLLGQPRMNRALLVLLPLLRRTCPDGLTLVRLEAQSGGDAADTVTAVFEGRGAGVEEAEFIERLKEFRSALVASPEVVSVDDIQKQDARGRSKRPDVHGFRCELTLRPWARQRSQEAEAGGEG